MSPRICGYAICGKLKKVCLPTSGCYIWFQDNLSLHQCWRNNILHSFIHVKKLADLQRGSVYVTGLLVWGARSDWSVIIVPSSENFLWKEYCFWYRYSSLIKSEQLMFWIAQSMSVGQVVLAKWEKTVWWKLNWKNRMLEYLKGILSRRSGGGGGRVGNRNRRGVKKERRIAEAGIQWAHKV